MLTLLLLPWRSCFYFGIRYEPETDPALFEPLHSDAVPSGVIPSTAYADIHAGNLGPNAKYVTRMQSASIAVIGGVDTTSWKV